MDKLSRLSPIAEDDGSVSASSSDGNNNYQEQRLQRGLKAAALAEEKEEPPSSDDDDVWLQKRRDLKKKEEEAAKKKEQKKAAKKKGQKAANKKGQNGAKKKGPSKKQPTSSHPVVSSKKSTTTKKKSWKDIGGDDSDGDSGGGISDDGGGKGGTVDFCSWHYRMLDGTQLEPNEYNPTMMHCEKCNTLQFHDECFDEASKMRNLPQTGKRLCPLCQPGYPEFTICSYGEQCFVQDFKTQAEFNSNTKVHACFRNAFRTQTALSSVELWRCFGEGESGECCSLVHGGCQATFMQSNTFSNDMFCKPCCIDNEGEKNDNGGGNNASASPEPSTNTIPAPATSSTDTAVQQPNAASIKAFQQHFDDEDVEGNGDVGRSAEERFDDVVEAFKKSIKDNVGETITAANKIKYLRDVIGSGKDLGMFFTGMRLQKARSQRCFNLLQSSLRGKKKIPL
jgi:hypothetical protein